MFIVFVGPPGSGKGTQAKRLVQSLRIPHLSTGDLLREAQQAGSALGKLVARSINEGRLVPDDLIVGLVDQRLEEPDCTGGCLFDGFPRTVTQAEDLEQILTRRGVALDVVIELRVDEQVLEQRILNRAELENRADDTPETIRKRLEVYRLQTAPVLVYYDRIGILQPVDGVGSTDEVHARIMQRLQRLDPQ